jgi:flagellar hook-associated protein 2
MKAWKTTVKVPAGTRLEGLAKAINNDPNNRGVTASIINDGQSTTPSYHLVLTGRDTGAAHTIQLVSDTMDNFDVAGTFEKSRAAANAMVKKSAFPVTISVFTSSHHNISTSSPA